MSTSVSSLSTNFFPSPQNGFSTTLASSISAGATSVPLNSVAGYANGDIAVLVIDPANSSKQTFTGVVDTAGIQLTSVVWTAGTNVAHTAGAVVTDYATATHIAMIAKGLKVAHNADGTHKSGAVYASPTFSGTATGTYTLGGTPTITSPTITGAVITNANLSTATGDPGGAWNSYTPTYTNITVGNGVSTARYIQIGKMVQFYGNFTFGSTSSMGTDPQISLPVAAKSGVYDLSSSENTLGTAHYLQTGTASFDGLARIYSGIGTSKMELTILNAAGTYVTQGQVNSTVPFTWGNTHQITWSVVYEAA